MNILFLTIIDFYSINDSNIYTDLLREFKKNDNYIYIVSPVEKRNQKVGSHIIKEENSLIVKMEMGNIQKTNVIEKGISTITLENKFVRTIKKYMSDIKFDFILYSTPPITLTKPIRYVKNRDSARTYLLLKDIFPQNAVDLKLMSPKGFGKILYRFFRNKEKILYRLSDNIGCMSPANVDYIVKHNPEISPGAVEVCPNSIEIKKTIISETEKTIIKKKYDIPRDKTLFIYGGNLGKPQGIDNMIRCIDTCSDISNAFFFIVGSGTEYDKVKVYTATEQNRNVKLLPLISKKDYDTLAASADVGLIFLDHKFTIPNFPSRLLSYMQASIPIIAATDENTDIGTIIENAGIGMWCESNNPHAFRKLVINMINREDRNKMGEMSYEYLKHNYSAAKSYAIINNHFK